jgi:uncharacterized protein affecting Mg2+/Co2+ transport
VVGAAGLCLPCGPRFEEHVLKLQAAGRRAPHITPLHHPFRCAMPCPPPPPQHTLTTPTAPPPAARRLARPSCLSCHHPAVSRCLTHPAPCTGRRQAAGCPGAFQPLKRCQLMTRHWVIRDEVADRTEEVRGAGGGGGGGGGGAVRHGWGVGADELCQLSRPRLLHCWRWGSFWRRMAGPAALEALKAPVKQGTRRSQEQQQRAPRRRSGVGGLRGACRQGRGQASAARGAMLSPQVRGEAVVGKYPLLEAGGPPFAYQSCTQQRHERGWMQGDFKWVARSAAGWGCGVVGVFGSGRGAVGRPAPLAGVRRALRQRAALWVPSCRALNPRRRLAPQVCGGHHRPPHRPGVPGGLPALCAGAAGLQVLSRSVICGPEQQLPSSALAAGGGRRQVGRLCAVE